MRANKRATVIIIFIVSIISVISSTSNRQAVFGPDDCEPTVIAHRGASGYVPEHTLGAYALSITMGSDYVEPDIVMTKDGYIIARHENELSITTDVSERPEFANKYRTQNINNFNVSGWFSEDFTLSEIKTLRSIERMPTVRPGNTRMDGSFDVPHFQEIIDLVKALEISENRIIGIYPEIKYPTHFQSIGLSMEQPLVDIFHNNGYVGPHAPAYIQSFEVSNLKKLKEITDIRLIQLFGGNRLGRPFDQFQLGTNLTYGEMASAEGLAEVSTYASAVGPDKSYIIPRNASNNLGAETTFVADAHSLGMKVHPYTFRSENVYLPLEFRRDDSNQGIGDVEGELRVFLAAGIDGAFIDQPDVMVRFKTECTPPSGNNFSVNTKHHASLLLHYVAAMYILCLMFYV